MADGHGAQRGAVEVHLPVRIRRGAGERSAGNTDEHAVGVRTLDRHQRDPRGIVNELDVVGDDELLERRAHRRRPPRRHVQPHLVGQGVDAQVRHHLPLLCQQRRRDAVAVVQTRDVVRHHALQEGDPVGAGEAHDGTKSGVEQAAALAHRGVLVLPVAKPRRQHRLAERHHLGTAGPLDRFQLSGHLVVPETPSD